MIDINAIVHFRGESYCYEAVNQFGRYVWKYKHPCKYCYKCQSPITTIEVTSSSKEGWEIGIVPSIIDFQPEHLNSHIDLRLDINNYIDDNVVTTILGYSN